MNENDITLDVAVAEGSEGEVWKGELRGHGLYCNALEPDAKCLTVFDRRRCNQNGDRHWLHLVFLGLIDSRDSICCSDRQKGDPVWKEAEVSGTDARHFVLMPS